MKRVFANRPDWKRILSSRFYYTSLETPEFNGQITLLCLDRIREPLFVDVAGKRVCIADQGYAWLQQFPINEHYTVTTMFDSEGRIVQWYVDICLQTDVDPANIPWLDDLYLDIVIAPGGTGELLDADELEEALQRGEISASMYDLAWREANRIMGKIASNTFTLPALSDKHRQILVDCSKSPGNG